METLPDGEGPSNQEYFGESLLIEDYPIQVLPKLAVAIGLNEAVVVQQIFWLFKNKANGRIVNRQRWIFNTYEQWQKEHFPFWSVPTLKRIFAQLERMQVLVSCQPEHGMSRRKYYRLNEGMVNLVKARIACFFRFVKIKAIAGP